mmetsp:Transcript_5166/g.13639  ORF Transcript_5166/g.13639 Transcript_5166/m.13639 type:complete len:206 (-) Transcript_5166:439-1056(-)
MVLHQQLPLVFALHVQVLQALVHPYILAPLAVALAHLLEVGCALISGSLEGANRVSREDLDGAVHAELAVVEVDPVGRLHVMCENGSQAGWEEHSIRIHFNCPLVNSPPCPAEHRIPDLQEDVQVQCSAKLASCFAFQVHVDFDCGDFISQCDLLIAEYLRRVAREQARMLGYDVLQQFGLVARRVHQRKAVETPSRPYIVTSAG